MEATDGNAYPVGEVPAVSAIAAKTRAAIARDFRTLADRLPPGPWVVSETETRIAIKAGRRTIAYVQLAGNDEEIAAAISAVPDLIAALRRCVRQGDLPIGVDADARSALIRAGAAP
jgi:hypothetical protein